MVVDEKIDGKNDLVVIVDLTVSSIEQEKQQSNRHPEHLINLDGLSS